MGEMPNRAADHLVHVPQVRAHRLRHADAVAGIGSRTVEIDRIGFEMVDDHLLILLESAARQHDPLALAERDRKSVVSGKSVSMRVDLGGRRIIKKNTK